MLINAIKKYKYAKVARLANPRSQQKKPKDYGIMQKKSCKAKPNLHLFFCTLRDLFRFLLVFYHPCCEKHIKFLLCQYSTFHSQPPFQQFALVVHLIQVLLFLLVVLPSSVGFVGVFSLGVLLWVAVSIHWLVVALFGFIPLVSVLFRLCPFRALALQYFFVKHNPK